MATLEKIRNRAGLLVGIVGLALFAFIIGDFLNSGSTFFRQNKEKIVVVDGQAIGYQEFMRRAESLSDAYKSNYGRTLTEEQQDQIRQTVYDEMTGKILLDNTAKKIGLIVGSEERNDMIMGRNISPMIQQYFRDPQTGAFDRNQYMQFLQIIESDDMWDNYPPSQRQQLLAQRMQWEEMKTTMIDQKLLGKLGILLTSTIVTNAIDARANWDETTVNIDFDFVSQTYTSIPDSVVIVTNNEIKDLYEKRKEEFTQAEARVISYIAVHVTPSVEDIKESLAHLENVKKELQNTDDIIDVVNDNSDVKFTNVYFSKTGLNENERMFVETAQVGDVEGPVSLSNNIFYIHKLVDKKEASDSVKLNLYTLPKFIDDAQLTAYADSLLRVVAGGKPFTELILELTGGQNNGEIGWQTEASLIRNDLDVDFVNALFNSGVNKVFLQRTTLNNFLVQVSEKTKPVTKYKVGTIQSAISASQETMNNLYNGLNVYISKNGKLESFKNSAESAGFIIQKEVPVFANQPGLSSIEGSRAVIRWAFNQKKGSISDIMQAGDYYIVAALEGRLKEGYRSLNDVADILRRELINQKKSELIINNVEAKNPTSLESYATAMNSRSQEVRFVTFTTPRIASVGVEPAVNAMASLTEKGQMTAPFAGKNAVFVLSITDKRASEQPFDLSSQMETLNMQNSYRIVSFMQNNALLRENAKIEDNRIRFF